MKFFKLTAASIISLLLLSIAGIFPVPAYAGSGPGFYITPSTNIGTAVNGTFTVTVWITNITIAQPVFAWQVKISYNKTQLKCINAKYSAGAHSQFFSAWPNASSPGPSYGVGYVLIGETLLGTNNETGGGASKTLFNATFQNNNLPPPKFGSLSSVLDLAVNYPGSTWAKDTSLVVIPMTNLGNANYSFVWAAPAPPTLGFVPTSVLYDRYTAAVGKSFTVNVTLKSLSALWYLLNASFTLNYRDAETTHIINMTGYTFNPKWGVATIDNTTSPGKVVLFVSGYTPSPPSGDVLIVSLKFRVIHQGTFPTVDSCKIDNSTNVELWADPATIPGVTVTPATVTVEGFLALPLPYLQSGNKTVGPNPVVGLQFDVPVYVKNLDYHWYVIGIQFKMGFDPAWIQPTTVIEGPFLKYFANLQPNASDGKTFMISFINPTNVMVGIMILPNATGWWNNPYPRTNPPGPTPYPPLPDDGIVAWVRFQVIQQVYPLNHTVPLPISWVDTKNFIGLDDPVTQNIVKVWNDPAINGTFTITTNLPGRSIDLVGGAKNDGYGPGYPGPFPAPYGGQGLNQPMDIVFPQSEVTLYATVLYNWWPVQSKDVGFEIEGPFTKLQNGTLVKAANFTIWAKLTAITDTLGVAKITFRMPWPCVNPENITGIWMAVATASVADVVLMDTMPFYYEHLVYITKVTTDAYYYNHLASVSVTVDYQTHAMQNYPALFATTITDNLGVPFGMALVTKTIGGAVFCTWKTGEFTVPIPIPKWAYVGIATVHVNVYDKDPTIGGFPWNVEFAPAKTIFIEPY